MNLSTREVACCIRPAMILAVKAPYLHAETVCDLRRSLEIPVINYYPDNPYCGVPWDPRKTSAQRHDLVDALRAYSHVWIWQPGLAARLRHDGVNAGYLPFAADAEVYRPHHDSQPPSCRECSGDHRIVLIGQHNPKRERHVGAITRFPVALWGSRWGRLSPKLSLRHHVHGVQAFGAGCSKAYSQAMVSLNVLDDLNMPGHNMRTFEIPASGGVMLATFTEEQAELFPEDEAACYYRAPEELDGKIERLLRDADFRDRVARIALRIAANHTYEDRVSEILRQCPPKQSSSRLAVSQPML